VRPGSQPDAGEISHRLRIFPHQCCAAPGMFEHAASFHPNFRGTAVALPSIVALDFVATMRRHVKRQRAPADR
jgi:hypothetical protein